MTNYNKKTFGVGDLITLTSINKNHSGVAYRSYETAANMKYFKGASGEVIKVSPKTLLVKFTMTNPAKEVWTEEIYVWSDEIILAFTK